SAFWLRSSVVSVLISLISDMWAIGPLDINSIFLGRKSIKIACYLGFHESPMLHYCTGLAQPTKSIIKIFL
ncbi:unnamed protein product, partial [Brassica rapa subsp. narinosa]